MIVIMKKTLAIIFSLSLWGSVAAVSPLDYVEPRIGTDYSASATAGMFGKGTEELGQVIPAVLEPNGMNFWTPQTRDTERKCVAPYYYYDDMLQGFRNSHWINGGCTQDYGSVTVMALGKTLRTSPAVRASRMDRTTEVSRPDYYSVYLPDERIKTEMTATSRSAIFRFTYDRAGKGFIVVNPNSDEAQGSVSVDVEARRITARNPVHRIYQGKGEEAGFAGYYVLEWPEDVNVTAFGVFRGDSVCPGVASADSVAGLGAYIEFDVAAGETVAVRAASSFTSLDGAMANLRAEMPSWDFDGARRRLTDVWEGHLGKIRVEGGSDTDKIKFYSALYRCSFLPRATDDVDGAYPSFAGGRELMKAAPGHHYYDDFSLWDTYRALHPLLLILEPEKSADMMQSLADKYEQGGWMPIFPCWNSYTAAMIGDHVASVVADAYVKGVRGFDVAKAYRGLRQNAFESPADPADYRDGKGRRALESYLKYGYLPLEDTVPYAYHKREQVSRTLEYAYDDYALSVLAEALGHKDDAKALRARSQNYRNVIDPATGYARGRYADGSWQENFNPFTFNKAITEGAPCHYTWYVPHDRRGLIDAMGGREVFAAKLDSMFTAGRYWHGNEPCHQVAWMLNDAGEPEKTRRYVRAVMDNEYHAVPGGLSGNDDAGQMSAWYVFAALGFYPVCPGTTEYTLGLPLFGRVEIAQDNGRTFTIKVNRRSSDDFGVKSMKLNGKSYKRLTLDHADITSGSTLEITTSPAK